MSKLKKEDKIEIYKRRKKGESISSLAQTFNVNKSNIKYLGSIQIMGVDILII